MYLLDTTTFTHHYFAEPNVPDYAILSHRWDETEVSFAEIFSGKDCQKLPGFPKIRGCCSQARLDGWGYVWIDSCCIDKSSSAELSEAIKSMFLWYSQAQVCYVYLSDVPVTVANGQPSFELDEMELLCAPFDDLSFRQCQWFTRGWILQELLAPKFVVFLNQKWEEIGTKMSLCRLISSITGIRDEILLKLTALSSSSVSERFS